jgi:phosphohistidine swiveling domain-containing protein
MTISRIIDLRKLRGNEGVGSKAINLHWLIQHLYKVPLTYVLPYSKPESAGLAEFAVQDDLLIELEKILDPEQSYAVRSSANLEDSQHHSYAGQFKTILNLKGVEQVSKAIIQVLKAGASESVQAYRGKTGQDMDLLHMAVIIQEMVQPVVSGVSFSKNPLTSLDEVIVEAVQGSGEALVQQGKTPSRWVYKWGDWVEQPVESQVGIQLIQQVVSQTLEISKSFGAPVDLEWVYDGRELFWVQLRAITHLNEVNIYSNRISKEVFPGLIKPLVWSVNVPLINTVWIQLFTKLIGKNDLQPNELARSFAYRAYFNMGVIGKIFGLLGFPKESLELLMGMQGGEERPRFRPSAKTMRHLPRMLSFAASSIHLGPKIMPAIQQTRSEYAALKAIPLRDIEETKLLADIDRLYRLNQKMAFFNILVPLLMNLYNLILRRQFSTVGVDFSTFDLTSELRELKAYDPNPHLDLLASEFNQFDQLVHSYITGGANLDAADLPQVLSKGIDNFIDQFGHLSDSGNDFSSIPWRENRFLVMQMILSKAQHQREVELEQDSSRKFHPYDELPGSYGQLGNKITWEQLKLTPFQRLCIKPIYQRARQFRLYREAVSFTYTYGYGLFRDYFLEIGRRFVRQDLLEEADDIFYLSWEEVKEILQNWTNQTGEFNRTRYLELVLDRKRELESNRELILPEIIYGNELPPMQQIDQPGNIRTGIPSSGGYYRGPAKVIRRISDFGKLCAGDVLVIPYSDVSWTPLFSRAGAVISESGGMLSHSSIVAREFKLPCVVSVPLACQIPDDTIVTVNGYKGEIYLHNPEG